jgi:hypothetical protein
MLKLFNKIIFVYIQFNFTSHDWCAYVYVYAYGYTKYIEYIYNGNGKIFPNWFF